MWTKINFQDHPTNFRKKVFFFEVVSHADHFEAQLNEAAIPYEKQIDHEGDQKVYFGVSSSDFEAAKKLNYITLGKFRDKFIPDTALRWFVIGISVIVLTLTFLGVLFSN